MKRWTEREFAFDSPVWMYPNLVSRVRSGPARLEDLTAPLTAQALTARHGDDWSIQEHAGHLLDIEELMAVRLEQLLAGVEALRAWDGENRATWEAKHNKRSLPEIQSAFRASRARFAERLAPLDEKTVLQSAFHPRLKKPMRVIDLVSFVAEHDDHHLATISALLAEREQAASAR